MIFGPKVKKSSTPLCLVVILLIPLFSYFISSFFQVKMVVQPTYQIAKDKDEFVAFGAGYLKTHTQNAIATTGNAVVGLSGNILIYLFTS